MSRYYDWGTTLSKDADINIIITSRGRGKTYGLRRQCIRDHLKDGSRFVEVTRTKAELKEIADNYFDRVGAEFPGYVFRVRAKVAYIAKKPPEGKKVKADQWRTLGYFVAMTELQTIKKRTFNRVRRILMDEAILERIDRYHTYLPYEWECLQSIVDSCTRERADDTERVHPKVYLLGNACDLINPWFRALGIDRAPAYGYTWYANKLCLLHYEKPGEYEQGKARDTLAGRMAAVTGSGSVSIKNEFGRSNMDFVQPKPKRAKFDFGIKYEGETFGVWEDKKESYIFVTRKVPNNARPIYALTAKDGRANLNVARRAEPALKYVVNLYYAGIVLYDSPYTREKFLAILALFGVR